MTNSFRIVYDISILSNIPLSVSDMLDPDAPAQRLRPLFTVGVHDIPTLVEYQAPKDTIASQPEDDTAVVEDSGCGWIACTTDSILAVKGELWDMLITMPPPYATNAKEKCWPTVESPKGVPVRATQRDLRRFKHLQASLAQLTRHSPPPSRTASGSAPSPGAQPASTSVDTSPQQATSDIHLSRPSAPSQPQSPLDIPDYESEKIVEPSTWAALAYSGFMWWASAGEQRRGEEADETGQDAALLADLGPLAPTMSGTPGLPVSSSLGSLGRGGEAEDDEDERARTELAIIAYFHRLTTQMLSVLADIVDSSDEDDILGMDVASDVASAAAGSATGNGGGDDDRGRLLGPGVHSADEDTDDEGLGAWVRIDSDALANMGLDVWSQSDAEFVRDLTPRYFARRVYVEGKGVEVCGLRVC
jgi:hypothetical protein